MATKVFGVLIGNDLKEYGFLGNNKKEVMEYAAKYASDNGFGKIPLIALEEWSSDPAEIGYVKTFKQHPCMQDIINYSKKPVMFKDGYLAHVEGTAESMEAQVWEVIPD